MIRYPLKIGGLKKMMGVNVGNSNAFKVETESDGTFMMELTEISLLFLGLDNGMQLLFSEKIMKLE